MKCVEFDWAERTLRPWAPVPSSRAAAFTHMPPGGRWVNRLHVSCLGWWGYHLGPQPLSRCRGPTGSGFPGSTKSSRSRGWACRVHLLRLWHFSTAESTPLGSLERRRLKSKENWRCLINPSHFSELKRNIIALLLGLSPSNYLNHTMGYGCKISVKQYFVNMYTIWFWKSWTTKYSIFIGFDSTNGRSICMTYIRVLCTNAPSGSFLFLLGVSLTPWNLTPATYKQKLTLIQKPAARPGLGLFKHVG